MRLIQLSEGEAKKLQKIIQIQSLEAKKEKSENEMLRVKEENLNFILYNSLKLVYDNTPKMIEILDRILIDGNSDSYIIGADEVGKGEWYGPLVVVAVALESQQINELRKLGIRDSKTMNVSNINKLAKKVLNNYDLIFHKVLLNPKKYNELYFDFTKENKNLNDLLAWAHSAAIKEVLTRLKQVEKKIIIIIDKFDFQKLDLRLRKIKKENIEIIQKAHGESEIPVALASILAKYFFEKEIHDLNYKYNIDLKNESPDKLSKEVLFNVAKIHFKNVEF
jgi:ribonuclease HIII